MRLIFWIILHCSAVMPSQTSSVEQINEWHLQNGWNGVGYHYVIRRNGDIEIGRTLEVVGAHCLNHNLHSIGICYEGGLDDKGQPADTRTKEQKRAIRQLLVDLKKKFPKARIAGHNEFSDKACPCFDVSEYSDLQPKPN